VRALRMSALSATRTLVSEVSLQRSRMTAIPSALQLSDAEALMLHVRGLRLSHFRKGLEAVILQDDSDVRSTMLFSRFGGERASQMTFTNYPLCHI
jgi:hypothetical protein